MDSGTSRESGGHPRIFQHPQGKISVSLFHVIQAKDLNETLDLIRNDLSIG